MMPALGWLRKFAGDTLRCEAGLSSSGPPAWPNAKVFSLSKMIPGHGHDYFVISDSDVQARLTFCAM